MNVQCNPPTHLLRSWFILLQWPCRLIITFTLSCSSSNQSCRHTVGMFLADLSDMKQSAIVVLTLQLWNAIVCFHGLLYLKLFCQNIWHYHCPQGHSSGMLAGDICLMCWCLDLFLYFLPRVQPPVNICNILLYILLWLIGQSSSSVLCCHWLCSGDISKLTWLRALIVLSVCFDLSVHSAVEMNVCALINVFFFFILNKNILLFSDLISIIIRPNILKALQTLIILSFLQ